MVQRRPSDDLAIPPERLDALIEEATVDCHDEEEQATGFFAMIEGHLALPFATRILGVEVAVVSIDQDDDGGIVAVCRRGEETQRIGLAELKLPSPPPAGAEWIAAYRRWASGWRD
jgi:hypothetical protein